MPRGPGRPCTNFEERILQEMSAHQKKAKEIVAQKINLNTPSIMAFEAASLLLRYGSDSRKIELTPIYHTINQYAYAHGPHGRWPGPNGARDFLEEFIQRHAPNWNWRAEAVEGDIEHQNYQRENERIAKEHAEDARWRMACASKFFTPDSPNAVLLQSLAWEWRTKRVMNPHARHWWENYKHYQVIRTTWPSLRELKLATAISERTLGKIIRNLKPKKTEITKEPRIVPRIFDASLRKFGRRGAVPLRYGPRLVIGVLNELVHRLRDSPMDDEERERLRKVAINVKRAFVARLSSSR